ncbi:MAG: cell division protein ZapD [Betaproteobacteria bacterium]|nr:cell division protein ZapD [Betaproteobacteria bacterium]
MIIYEYPLNERVRTLLRLEDLFDRTEFFRVQDSPQDHHASLAAIFEILEVASRGDLKSDLLQELDRQRLFLEALRSNPAISEEKLDAVVAEIESSFSDLLSAAGKTGQHLRENEWLMTIKQRAAIPGGTCEFDLPSFHHWLHRDSDARRADLDVWLRPFLPVACALRIVLRVLRESGKSVPLIAYAGLFQQMPMERSAHMLRLTLSRDLPCVPEISANKYALNIRFILPGSVQRTRLHEADIEFGLTYCNL